MKIRMLVRCPAIDDEWWENYDQEEVNTPEEAETWCKDLMDNFNSTLRPYDHVRKFVRVEIVGESVKKHQWRKINAITISRGGSYYDIYECSKCGITGKRYGIGGGITLDRKFKAKKYANCSGGLGR